MIYMSVFTLDTIHVELLFSMVTQGPLKQQVLNGLGLKEVCNPCP